MQEINENLWAGAWRVILNSSNLLENSINLFLTITGTCALRRISFRQALFKIRTNFPLLSFMRTQWLEQKLWLHRFHFSQCGGVGDSGKNSTASSWWVIVTKRIRNKTARPTVQPVAITIFTWKLFCLILKSGDGLTDVQTEEQHVWK